MGEVAVEVKLPGQVEPDVLALPVPEGGEAALSNGAKVLDEQLKGRLGRLAEDGELRGELGKTLVLHTDGDLRARHLAAAGIGRVEDLDSDALRTAAAAVARATDEVGGTLAWLLDETLPLPLDEQARAVVEGIVLGSYRPGRWKTGERRPRSVDHSHMLRSRRCRGPRRRSRSRWARPTRATPPESSMDRTDTFPSITLALR